MKNDDSGQEYAELLCDFMFKRLFGSEENKDVLIAFLNVMLEDVDIVDVFSSRPSILVRRRRIGRLCLTSHADVRTGRRS